MTTTARRETAEQRRQRDERNAALRDERNAALRTATRVRQALEGWEVVAEYDGSKGATHTVTFDGRTHKCTCQDFRIRREKLGLTCKHIDWYKDTGRTTGYVPTPGR